MSLSTDILLLVGLLGGLVILSIRFALSAGIAIFPLHARCLSKCKDLNRVSCYRPQELNVVFRLPRRHALALLLLFCSGAAPALEPVTLQLKWRHQFQFAGYYAALEKGYYREAGLDVKLIEAAPNTDVIEEIASGRAQYGVGTSDLLLARRRLPVVALAVIFQHSPLILLARADRIDNLHQLAGQAMMVEPHSEELFAYLRSERLPPEKLRVQAHSQSPRDLIEGRVAAMSAYSTTEPFLLRQAGLRTIEFSPRAGGIDFYGDNLFTTERELKANPERVRAFRAASLRGWEYAMKYPEEIIDLILARYNSQGLSRDFLDFEAHRTAQLMQAQLVEVGHMNPGRWQHIADTYASLDMQAKGGLPAGFLYDDRPGRLPGWVLPAAIGGLVLLALFGFLAARNLALARRLQQEIVGHGTANRELQRQLEENRLLEAKLKEQAIHDPLTGLFNRRYLDETLPREIARARREGYPLAFIMLDIDHFKQINDTHGHAVGDEVLRRMADILRQGAREGDLPCRYGGEEFLVVLPGLPLEAALAKAESWRAISADFRFPCGETSLQFTLSAGIAVFPDHGADLDTLLLRADTAMYDAKHAGRNRVSASTEKDAARC